MSAGKKDLEAALAPVLKWCQGKSVGEIEAALLSTPFADEVKDSGLVARYLFWRASGKVGPDPRPPKSGPRGTSNKQPIPGPRRPPHAGSKGTPVSKAGLPGDTQKGGKS